MNDIVKKDLLGSLASENIQNAGNSLALVVIDG